MADARPSIFIRPDGEGYAVSVEPEQPGTNWERAYPTHREARGWAGGIRLSTGWKLVDLCGDEYLKDVLGLRRERGRA